MWVEMSELSFTFTKKGKVVSNVEAQKLGVGELMARQGVVTNKLADSGLLVVDCVYMLVSPSGCRSCQRRTKLRWSGCV